MRHVPYLNERDLALHKEIFESSFVDFARNSTSPSSIFFKYSSNTTTIDSFGDAWPEFLPGVGIDLVLVHAITEEDYKSGKFGIDERHLRQDGVIVQVLTSAAESCLLTNRDRISIDDVLYQVSSIDRETGLGHYSLVTVLVLFEVTQ
ncbi:hypothetical protein KAU11_10170 [Candidatus Babeliales bacterium]|nr:hypothetical protein [Candidatus Babeliales bacterium]